MHNGITSEFTILSDLFVMHTSISDSDVAVTRVGFVHRGKSSLHLLHNIMQTQ